MSKVIPTLFIGLGGTGFYSISEIKKNIAKKYFKGNPDFPLNSYLAIDTEFLSADKIEKLRGRENSDELEFIITFDSSNIKDVERIETTVVPDNIKNILSTPALSRLDDFVPERANESIEVKGDGASGVGLVGKIALAINFSKVANRIKDSIDSLLGSDANSRLNSDHDYAEFTREDRFNAFIFCSFGGGTGKGMALIIAAMLKEMLHTKFHGERQKYNIAIINYLPSCFKARGRSVANDEATYQYILKNQYATYKELEWCFSHGYSNEEFFRNYFNKPSNSKTEDFVNSVYNVSANLENSGTEISSYDSINKIVSEVFTFIVMNQESNAILQSVSNDTQKIESAVSEKGTGLKRNRKYCRIGRYNLIMPENKLFEFADIFYTQKLLTDFLEGGIEKGKSYSDITGIDGKPETRPEELSRKKCDELTNIFDQHYNRCPVLSAGELNFPNLQNYQLNYFINPINSEIQALDSYKVGFDKADNLSSAITLIDEFLLMSIRFSGLLYARDFLKELNIQIERKNQLRLEKLKEKNEFGAKEILKGLGNVDEFAGTIEVEEFQFSVSEGVWSRLNTKYEDGIIQVREYVKPEKFQSVSDIIAPLRQPKKIGFFNRLFKTINDERIPFPEDAKSLIFGIVNNFNKQMAKVWLVFTAREYLSYSLELNKHITNRFEKINDFIVLLSGTGKERAAFSLRAAAQTSKNGNDALLKEVDNEFRRRSLMIKEANESNIIGDNEHEFKIFAKNVLPYETIIKDIHNKFNNELVDELFTVKMKLGSEELFFKTIRICNQRLKKERYDETGNKNWTIINYMHYLLFNSDEKTKQQIEENLQKLKTRSRFLSSVDTSKFESPGAAETSFPQQNFLEIADINFLPSNIKDWEQYTHKAKLIPQDNNEQITLTRIQGLIPLFAFTDLQEAQKLYSQVLNSTDSEDSKHNFKVKTHTSRFFMEGIDEPFGQTLQIDKNDVINIWNMAFHLGIVNVNESDYIQILNYLNELIDYEDPTINVRLRENRKIRVATYANSHNDYFHLTSSINNLIFERLNSLAQDPVDGKIILKKYFTDIKYPLIPKTLFDVVFNSLDDRKFKDLIYQVKILEQDYLAAYEKVADLKMRKRSFIMKVSELEKEYPGAIRYLSYFTNLVKNESRKSLQQTEVYNRKLSKVNSLTQWFIIVEEDKGQLVFPDIPAQNWKESDKLFKTIENNAVPCNLYSPDLDLIVNQDEFKKLIPKFVFDEAVRELRIDKLTLNKQFHVVSFKSGRPLLLTEKTKFTIEKIIEILKDDSTVRVSEKEKPSKEDWGNWSDNETIKRIFENINSLENADKFELPEF